MGFAIARFASILAFTIGIAGLMLPYLTLLGLVASAFFVNIIRIAFIEAVLISAYSDAFNCKKEE